MLIMLDKNFRKDILEYVSYFFLKIGFDISCKLSQELLTRWYAFSGNFFFFFFPYFLGKKIKYCQSATLRIEW